MYFGSIRMDGRTKYPWQWCQNLKLLAIEDSGTNAPFFRALSMEARSVGSTYSDSSPADAGH